MNKLLASLTAIVCYAAVCPAVRALPPAEDIPEEQLRTEIVTEARSPLDGQPLTAAEYAQLQADLAQAPTPDVPTKYKDLIFLLQVRQVIRTIFPF